MQETCFLAFLSATLLLLVEKDVKMFSSILYARYSTDRVPVHGADPGAHDHTKTNLVYCGF